MSTSVKLDETAKFTKLREETKSKIDIYLKRRLDEKRRSRRPSGGRKDPRGRKKVIAPSPEDVAFRDFLKNMFFPDGYFFDFSPPHPWVSATKVQIRVEISPSQ